MRNVRTLLLLAMTAITAMAFAASTATAQGPNLRIQAEVGPPHVTCPGVTLVGTTVDGGCLLHGESAEVELRKHVFFHEEHITACSNEFHGRVAGNGEGYIMEQILDDAGGVHNPCNREPCKDGIVEPRPWVAHANEGVKSEPTATEYMTVTFCVEPHGGGADETCEIDVPFNKLPNNHTYEFGHATEMPGHGAGGFRCELVGHWLTETGDIHDLDAEQEVEVDHIQ